jgi:hypothetical protein
VFTKDIDLCLLRTCPIGPGQFPLNTTFPIPNGVPVSEDYFKLPIVDLGTSVRLKDASGNLIGCTQTTTGGGALSAKSWGVSVSGLFLAVTAITSLLNLASNGGLTPKSSPTSAPTFLDVLSFCHFVSMSGMVAVNLPSFYLKYTTGFAWTNFLIPNEVTNAIANSKSLLPYRSATMTAVKSAALTASDAVLPLALDGLKETANLDKQEMGISRYGRIAGIEPDDLFLTAIVLGELVCLAFTAIALLIRLVLEGLKQFWPYKLVGFRKNFVDHYLGM